MIHSRGGHLFYESSHYELYGFGFVQCIFIFQEEFQLIDT